jgi:hypothetical protein
VFSLNGHDEKDEWWHVSKCKPEEAAVSCPNGSQMTTCPATAAPHPILATVPKLVAVSAKNGALLIKKHVPVLTRVSRVTDFEVSWLQLLVGRNLALPLSVVTSIRKK